MAPEKEETGGIVTTIKKNITDDLDVRQRLEDEDVEIKDGDKPTDDEKPGKDESDEKPGTSAKNEDDDEVDFKALPKSVQRAINRSNADRRKADKQTRELRAELEELKTKLNKPDKKDGEQAPAAHVADPLAKPRKPRPEDFNGPNAQADFDKADEAYDEQLVEWKLAIKEAKEQEEAEKAEDALLIDEFNKKAVEFEAEHDDYRDVMDNPDIRFSAIQFGMVIEDGPRLGYFFANNPKEAERIRLLTDNPEARKSKSSHARAERKAIREIDKIIIKLDEQDEKAKKKEEKEEPARRQKEPEPHERLDGRGGAPAKEKSQKSYAEREAEYAARRPGELNYR